MSIFDANIRHNLTGFLIV